MKAFAQVVAKNLQPGEILGLSGPLGVGKTEFSRAFAQAIGVRESISSPTFVLEVVYEVHSPHFVGYLHHWDLYRIRDEAFDCELRDLYRDSERIVLIEWPEKVPWIEDLLDLQILIAFPAIPLGNLEYELPSEAREIRIQGRSNPELVAAVEKFLKDSEL